MAFDPFQLVTTPVDVIPPATPPPTYKEEVPLISPSVPPVSTAKDGTKNVGDLFSAALQRARMNEVKNGPLYIYGTKEEKRYANPNLQFKPEVLGGYDIEDIYAGFQGTGEKWWNALVKTGATASNSFISGFTGFGDQIDQIRTGKLFDPNSTLGDMQGWLTELEDKYPNYYSQWEREHPYASALPFSGGFANFWGDKILKNAGFTIGSLASGVLVDAGIDLATGGAGTPASFILLAKQIERATAPLKKAFRALVKSGVGRNVDDFVGLARVAGSMDKAMEAAASGYNLKRGLQFAATTYFSAQGEAMIEGYQNYYQTKSDLINQAADKGNVAEKVNEIEDISQQSGKYTTLFNIPIIAASNILQFSNVLSGRNLLKTFESPFLEVINKEGLTLVNNYSRKKAIAGVLKEVGKDFASEGFEEGYQYYIGNALHDYYVDRYNTESKKGMLSFVASQIPKTLEDDQFWQQVYVGGLSGALMGAYHPIRKHSRGKTDEVIKRLQPVYDRFNSSVKDLVHLAENVEFSQDEDTLNQFYAAHKSLFSTVHDSIKYGAYDNFMDSLNDLRELPVEEYNKLFNTEFKDDIDKGVALTHLINEARQIEKEVTNTAKFFSKNPFEDSYVSQKLQKIFNVNDIDVKELQKQMFDHYKELVAYNLSRLRNINEWVVTAEDGMKTMGLDQSILPVLRTLSTEKAKGEYVRLKNLQLDALKQELEYQKELGNEPEVITLGHKIKQLEKFVPLIEKVNNDDALFALIFSEEMSKDQMLREEEFIKKAKELKENEQVKQNVEKDLQDQVAEPEEAAKEQVSVVEELKPTPEKKKQNVNFYNTFVKQFGGLKQGDKFTVSTVEGTKEYTVSNQRGGAVDAVDAEGNTYVFSANQNQPVLKNPNTDSQEVYQFTPTYEVKKVEQVEQPLPPKEPVEEKPKPKRRRKTKEVAQKTEEVIKKEKKRKEEVAEEKVEPKPKKQKKQKKQEEEAMPGQWVSIADLLKQEGLEEESSEGWVNIEDLLRQEGEQGATVADVDKFIQEDSFLKQVMKWKQNKGITIKCT